MTTTVLRPDPDGNGFREVTTNEDGTEIRNVHIDSRGEVVEYSTTDPATGERETTTYEGWKKQSKEVFRREQFVEGWVYDERGREWVHEIAEDDGTTTKYETTWRDDGLVDQVAIIKGTSIVQVILFYYDDDGRLIQIVRESLDGSGDSSYQLTDDEWISDDRQSDPELLVLAQLLLASEYEAQNRHSSLDDEGNSVTVTHNADHSFDVLIVDQSGRHVRSLYYAIGNCYLGADCPFRRELEDRSSDRCKG